MKYLALSSFNMDVQEEDNVEKLDSFFVLIIKN